MFSNLKGYRRLKEERTEDEEKTTWSRRGMGRVAPSMGDMLKMKRRTVKIKNNFVL